MPRFPRTSEFPHLKIALTLIFFKIIGFRRVVFIASVVSFDFYFSSTGTGSLNERNKLRDFRPFAGNTRRVNKILSINIDGNWRFSRLESCHGISRYFKRNASSEWGTISLRLRESRPPRPVWKLREIELNSQVNYLSLRNKKLQRIRFTWGARTRATARCMAWRIVTWEEMRDSQETLTFSARNLHCVPRELQILFEINATLVAFSRKRVNFLR